MKDTINNAGNSDDVYNILRCGLKNQSLTAESVKAALADEKKNRNRSSIIKHLERALKKL